MHHMDVLEACDIAQAAYEGHSREEIAAEIDIRGVQAYFLKSGVLSIPGSNEAYDWFEYNTRVNDPSMDGVAFDVAPGDSGSQFHAGFLDHAQTVYTFAKGLKPKFIVGHSLGAASAQIVGTSLRVPTIAFASPRTLKGKPSNRLRGEGWVVNYCRVDDTVCHFPRNHKDFRVLGSQYWLNPDEINVGEDHSMKNYRKALKSRKIRERVPMQWPR